MPRTIEQGFVEFHDKLKPFKTESIALKSHRTSIEACLKSNFGMYRFFRSGSIGNGTNISGYSDTDYFAVIPREKLKNSSSNSLEEIKTALKTRFPQTSIRISKPAIIIPFGIAKSETTEIIPADYIKTENGVNIYEIPDNNDTWMESSPKANNDYVTDINSKLSYKAKPLIRFIKAWNFYNNVSISSFYLEMRVAKYISRDSSVIYSLDIKNILKYLIDIDLAQMINPSGVPGYINGCKTETSKQDALSKLNTAYTRACKAWDAESENDDKTAFYYWNLLFNDKFTNYYY